MKKFILYVIFGLVFTISSFAIIFVISAKVVNANFDSGLNSNTKYLALGHSHPQAALNDSIIFTFKNYAQGGESYFYTYQKIKQILESEYKPNAIFVAFTNNQVESFMDEKIWLDKYVERFFKIYSHQMSFEDMSLIARNNPKGFFKGIILSLKLNINNIISGHFEPHEYFGGYESQNNSHIDSLLTVIDQTEKFDVRKENVKVEQTYTIQYLKKIINYCNQSEVKVYLIRFPQHQKYLGRMNENYFQDIMSMNFPNVSFIDLNDFPLENDEFLDLHHLNLKGSMRFSKAFNNALEQVEIEALGNYLIQIGQPTN